MNCSSINIQKRGKKLQNQKIILKLTTQYKSYSSLSFLFKRKLGPSSRKTMITGLQGRDLGENNKSEVGIVMGGF